MKKGIFATIGVLVVIVAIYVVFWSGPKTPQKMEAIQTSQNIQAIPPSSNMTAAEVSAATVKETFTVTGQNFSFAPAQLKVKKGDMVKIVFKNAEGFHDFVLDEFNVRTSRVKAGAEEAVTFKADKAGSFEYYCSVGTHRAMGMKGTLTVE